MARHAHLNILVPSVVCSLLLGFATVQGTEKGLQYLNDIAVRAYDGDSIALQELIESTKSANGEIARRALRLFGWSLNPGNLSILVNIFEEIQDENIRIAIVKSLADFAAEPEVKDILRAAKEKGGEIGTLAEELLAKPRPATRDDIDRRNLTYASTRPQAKANRDSLFQEFLQTEEVFEKLELARKLSKLGEDRLYPYVDDLVNQVDLPDNMKKLGLPRFGLFTLIRNISLMEGSELPADERQGLYEKILSAMFKEESLLNDLSGEPVNLKIPDVGTMKRDKVVYVARDYLVGDVKDLALEGYEVHISPMWGIKGVANKRKNIFMQLYISEIYTSGAYAVMSVASVPTSCIRYPGGFLCGGGSEILLKKIDGEWRFHSILSSWIS